MNILSFISTILATIVIIEGIYIWNLAPRSFLNRLYFFMNLCLFIWIIGAAIGYSAELKADAIFWYKFCSFGFIFLHAFTLHFCLVISKTLDRSRIIFLIYLPSIFFYYISLTDLLVFRDFFKYGDFWIGISGFDSLVNLFFLINYLSYYIISIFLLVQWHKRTPSKKEKNQAVILIASISLTVFLFNLEPFLLPYLLSYQTIIFSPNFGIIWASGVWYAIQKYRFLGIDDSYVLKNIFKNSTELIVLFDEDFNIKLVNKKFTRLSGIKAHQAKDKNLSLFFNIPFKVKNSIIESGASFFFTQIVLNTPGEKILLETNFFPVRDSFNDFIGYAAVAREIKSMVNLQADFKLSERESEMIKYLISGLKTKEIAENLKISPRTVKTHITNIYNKMGIDNRVQLMNLFSKYNI